MLDKAKVIKGLTACRKTICESCPYNASDEEDVNQICLINEMISDALAVIKEQENLIWELQEQVEYITDKWMEQERRCLDETI